MPPSIMEAITTGAVAVQTSVLAVREAVPNFNPDAAVTAAAKVFSSIQASASSLALQQSEGFATSTAMAQNNTINTTVTFTPNISFSQGQDNSNEPTI